MRRILTIAQNELVALVRTKFFLIGIFMVPALMGGLFFFLDYAEGQVDQKERVFGVVDRTGALYEPLAAAAQEHNRDAGDGADRDGPHFIAVRIDPGPKTDDELIVELSERVRREELFAFVVIPASTTDSSAKTRITYHSQNTSYERLSRWLESTLEEEIQKLRLRSAGVDPALVAKLSAHPEFVTFNLVERRADGSVTAAREVDKIEKFAIPVFFLVLMFMAVMSNAQHLINTIIEEKMSKISEVLLGSVSSFELLYGKLLGIVAVSFILAFVYLAGGIYALLSAGRPDLINIGLIGWFLVFLVCASLMFGSIFQALSAACSDLKDAQSMLQPAMFMVIGAYVASFLVIQAPDSSLTTVLSFIPTVTPFAMMIRLTMAPGPPLWEVLLSVALLIATTTAIVWAAGRIFRVGLLMQGKPPNLPELLRWVRR